MTFDTFGLISHPTPSPYPFGPRTVAAILDAGLVEHPERIALIDDDRSWTWAELDVAVAAVAAGISPGELLWWSVGNCAESIIGALATFRAGGVWIGRADQLARSHLPQVTDLLGPVRLVDSIDDMPRGDFRPPNIDPFAPALVTFTSGTTGRPKAVVHSQHNLLWPGLISIELEPPFAGERIGTPLSLSIANMLSLGPLSALLRGSTTVVMDRTHAAGFAKDVQRQRVNRCFVVPTILHDLVAETGVAPAMLESLDRVIVGGSGADPRLLSDFLDRFDVRPTLSYGLSEAPTGVVRESLDDPIGSGRGFPLPHVDVTIVDTNGEEVPLGNVGEVCLSPTTKGRWANTWTPTSGYAGEPERTTSLFHGGLLHTGDRGRLDADGALSITGRLSDLIIRGGKNVDPVELERRLAALPMISEALVVGLPDARLGQIVGALVVLEEGLEHLELTELVKIIKDDADVMLDALALAAALPRNEMGKLIRQIPPGLAGPDKLLG